MKMPMTLSFTVSPSKPSFVRGEPVYLILGLTNAGSEAVELPVPIVAGRCLYHLTAPTGKELREDGPADLNPPEPPASSARASNAGDDDVEVEPLPPRKDVQPRERWTGVVALDQLFALGDDGSYRIAARIQWNGLELDAPALEFKVEGLQVLQWSRGAGSAPEEGQASLLLLRPMGSERALSFSNVTLGDDEMDDLPQIGGPTDLRKLPKDALDPAESSSVSGLDVFWNFWREGNTLLGTRGAAKSPRRLDLPGRVERLVEPALLGGGRITHVYAVCVKDAAQTLIVSRFLDYLETDDSPPERLLAEIPLPAPPLGSDAFIDVVDKQDRRVVAFGRLDGKVPRIDWVSYLGESVPTGFRSHAWAKAAAAEPLPDSRPAIYGLREGGLRIAWIVREVGQPTHGLLCEATFDEKGALKSESTTPLAVASPIHAARAVYVAGVPYVALWTEDAKVMAGKGAELRGVVSNSLRRVPPMLLVLRAQPFVVDFDPVKGIVLLGVR
jgi:hypothetical protein